MAERLCLMQVHAHPDDEASKGAGTAARYAAEGVRCVLVTCTGGEAGEILNPAADSEEARTNIGAVRMRELQRSIEIIGYHQLYLLGYRDSGMPDSEFNKHPDSFANANLDEAVERLVKIIRSERPQVIIGYADDQRYYPHPDHLRAHDITLAAFEQAGDPTRYPEAGEPWEPKKLYYMGWTRRNVEALHAMHTQLEIESPYDEWLRSRPTDHDARFTTRIDVSGHLEQRRDALLAHETQIAPDSFWMSLPVDAIKKAYPYEEFILARSAVEVLVRTGDMEEDLFAGLRADA